MIVPAAAGAYTAGELGVLELLVGVGVLAPLALQLLRAVKLNAGLAGLSDISADSTANCRDCVLGIFPRIQRRRTPDRRRSASKLQCRRKNSPPLSEFVVVVITIIVESAVRGITVFGYPKSSSHLSNFVRRMLI